jgi:hypothetical protein
LKRTSACTLSGSTRGELQHWSVDLENRTAQIVKTSQRQLKKMAPRVSVKELAEEIADQILGGGDDNRLKRLEDGSVKVLLTKIFPTGSGFQRTVSGRRKRLIQCLGESLSQHGWVESASNVFKPPAN